MTNDLVRVLALSGSLRRESYNTALLETAADLAPSSIKVDLFGLEGIPLFNADLEPGGRPAPVEELRTAIARSEAVLLATPEYNGSTTAVLKNAIDWASRGPDSPLEHKPMAILGAGGRFGTLRAQLHLREILAHNAVRLVQRPQVYIDSPSTKVDESGRFADARTRDQIENLLLALADLAQGA